MDVESWKRNFMGWCLYLDDATRSLAGLILKNNLKQYYDEFPVETINLIKYECLNSLSDQSCLIRATVGILITTIHYKSKYWPELIPNLINLLDTASNDPQYEFGVEVIYYQW